MRVVYYLPKYNYFKEGLRGRTSHAHGFLSGLKKNQIDCTLVSGPGYSELYPDSDVANVICEPKFLSRSNIIWVAFSTAHLILGRRLNRADAILVVRYSKSVSLLTSIIFGVFWRGITVYEINSLAYHQSGSRSKSYLAGLLAVEKWIIGRFDVAMCVSNNIKIDLRGDDTDTLVLPNGSSLPPTHLEFLPGSHARFVYLGGFQPYYDFAQLFRCFLNANIPSAKLHVYGDATKYKAEFSDLFDHDAIKFKGSYDLNLLIQHHSLSRSDIFLLPNGRNRMARIGSPTKLFEYLAFGCRIIYQDYGQASDILQGLGGTYPYDNDLSLIHWFQVLSRQFDQPFSPPVGHLEYVSTVTWEARARVFWKYVTTRARC